MSVVIFLLILAILILVHEFGHFIVAKKSGIRVDEFGLGFPPKIWSKKFGQTLYTLNAIPFGGFVKIFGEAGAEGVGAESDEASRSFYYKPKYIQAMVLVAGVAMNLIFAWLLISVAFMIGLQTSNNYSSFGKVRDSRLLISEVIPNSPAEKAGLKSGDEIHLVSSQGDAVGGPDLTPENIQMIINNGNGRVEINYSRPDDLFGHVVLHTDDNIVPGKKTIGIAMDSVGILQLPVHLAVLEGAHTTFSLTRSTVSSLFLFIWNSVRWKSDLSQVSGPIGIVGVVAEAKSLGFVPLLFLVALISINLAIINLLPFPALDGGRLLFVGIEAIIRRPIKASFVKWTNTVGFALLIILMIVVTGHDILKLL